MTAFGQKAAMQAIKVQRIGFRHGTRFEAVKARPAATGRAHCRSEAS
jgi:hypothetical protein